jgi:hypothetical protein
VPWTVFDWCSSTLNLLNDFLSVHLYTTVLVEDPVCYFSLDYCIHLLTDFWDTVSNVIFLKLKSGHIFLLLKIIQWLPLAFGIKSIFLFMAHSLCCLVAVLFLLILTFFSPQGLNVFCSWIFGTEMTCLNDLNNYLLDDLT